MTVTVLQLQRSRRASAILRDSASPRENQAAVLLWTSGTKTLTDCNSMDATAVSEYLDPATDFIIETQKQRPGRRAHVVCVEVKLSPRWERRWERPMRDFQDCASIQVDRMIGVYTGEQTYRFDKLTVWPVEEFLCNLHKGEVF